MCQTNVSAALGIQEATVMLVRTESLNHELLFELKKKITLLTIDLRPCERQSPCQNGATCTNDSRGGYTCSCAPGYEGTNCQSEINECLPNPCQNQGTCTVD